MSIKQAKLICGFKSLLGGSANYQYIYNGTKTYNCTIKQLFQQQLQSRYPSITISKIIQQFIQYLSLPSQILGKRSSQITISASRKYCCKLIDEQSVNKIIQMLKFVWQHQDENKDTFLTPIYRIFKVQSQMQNFRQSDIFILMPCLRPKFQQILSVYDVKGYTQGRVVDMQDFKIFKFGKDQNFVMSKQLNFIQKLQKIQRQQFLKKFIADIKFLQSQNIIDYSLLISFKQYKESQQKQKQQNKNTIILNKNILMQWGIIDYFQQYNNKKKAQNKFKSFFKKDISSVEPQLYCDRFIKFIKKYFLLAS